MVTIQGFLILAQRLGYATPRSVNEFTFDVNGVRIILLLDGRVSGAGGIAGAAGAPRALPDGFRDGLGDGRRGGQGKNDNPLILSAI